MTKYWIFCFILVMMKLSWDDLKGRWVYHTDLILLNGLGLALFQMKSLGEWTVMITLILISMILSQCLKGLGEGDVAVILALGLISDLKTFLFLIQCALVMALLAMGTQKKARFSALPFVPFLSLAWGLFYLIRLRLIFS